MNLRVLVLVCLLFPLTVLAQKKEKPRMLVYGSNITALSAAIQAAKSNVPTVMLMDTPILAEEITSNPLSIEGNQNLDGGLWMKILMDMAISKTRSDSLALVVKRDFNSRLAQNAIDKYLTELPNLTIIKNQSVTKIVKGRRDWQVTLSNRQKYDVISIVDATEEAKLFTLADIVIDSAESKGFTSAKDMTLAMSRTTLAVSELNNSAHVVFLKDLLSSEKDSFFYISASQKINNTPETIAFKAAYGQALGATAAYCAFFKTTTNKIDIRKLQSELLGFQTRVIPYQDIEINNDHFNAIQKCYLTGFFLGSEESGKYLLNKDQNIRFDEIKEVFNEIYTRSQLWFLDNYRDDELTWKDLIGLIKFVDFKGDEVERQIEKDWKKKLKFEGDYHADRKVTREQFAVITDLFSSAFAKAINLDGTFVK